MAASKFAGFPTALIRETPGGKALKQLLWGDFVTLTGPAQNGWQPARSRDVSGFIAEAELIPNRLLEIVFVDIGQGDGALIVTPDDKHLLVDAGEGDNMYRFLRWRYGRFAKPFRFEAAVITHSDQDHYKGFDAVFADPKVSFGAIYHNGVVERAGSDSLGPRSQGYLTDVVETHQQLKNLVGQAAVRGTKQYPNMLHKALTSGRVADSRGVSAADGHLPNFAPGQRPLAIQLLGPVRDQLNGANRLKWFGDVGKTKNGHSVVLRIVYGDVSILLGGDLNIPAENHLLSKHTGYPSPPSDQDRSAMLEGARKVFRSDVAKACHHGSADFTDLFLQSVDPLVTIISSGDDEPYAHPRADSLGAVGRWGRGGRPLVFSTELARSARDTMTRPYVWRQKVAEAQAALNALPPGAQRDKAQKKVDDLLAQVERSIAVYGAINLRTDGQRIVMAQKIEAPRSKDKGWDIYVLEPDSNGVLRYTSKYEN
ncbi:MAG TPA: MBL fold metallo-hydrolase [Sphingomicrobium sp.]|nr:MBL fold metallo-hydrolase [Sphingomicrobium sp.]